MLKSIISWLLIIVLWQLGAMGVNNTILLPYPLEVFSVMVQQVMDVSLYVHVLDTLTRMGIAFVVALMISFCFVLGLKKGGLLSRLIDHLLVILRIVPTAAIILMALVWLSAHQAVILITLLVMIPLMSDLLYQQLNQFEKDFADPLKLYGDSALTNLFQVLIPLSLPAFLTLCKSAFLLGLKVAISSEVLVSIRNGIGRELQYARFDLDMNRLFASTIWIILIALIVSKGFDLLIGKYRY